MTLIESQTGREAAIGFWSIQPTDGATKKIEYEQSRVGNDFIRRIAHSKATSEIGKSL